jgi:hypothetical protein
VSTHRTEWHADVPDLAAYAAGEVPPVPAASIEAHLIGCAACRAQLGAVSDAGERGRAWDRLADVIDRPSTSLVARITGGHWLARSAVATPAMVRAALVAVLLVGVVPLVTASAVGDAGLVALLVLAPLAPVAAVALAYRDRTDPAGEISLPTPTSGLRLVAQRALVVASVALPMAFLTLGAVDLWIEDVPVRLALAWCLPGLALSALVLLAGTTRFDPTQVAVALSGAWALLVAVGVTVRRTLRPEALADLVAGPAVQTASLALAVLAITLTVVRRDAVAYRRIG